MKFPKGILDQHTAILGKTRAGKTNTAKLVIEQVVAAGSRVCIIDPIKADYWGLTSSADGKHPGLPFHILGGAHGHVPLHAGAAQAVAEVVATGALKLAIVDMENFGPRESGPFFASFMETIFRRIQGVLYLVIDEAHLFAPKDGRGGDESMATYWFKRMASGSGSKGVRLIVSTQRVQELHNTVLSNCDTVIAHRVTFPEDQKRISDWVASHASKELLADVKRSLPNLQRGEAWICSGEAGIFERRQMPLCSTYDNSRTPSDDERRREVKTAQIDQDALRSIIGTAVDEAKANDPKELKSQIAKLRAELSKKPAAVVDESAISKATAARDREWKKIIEESDRTIENLWAAMEGAAKVVTHNAEQVAKILSVPHRPIARPDAVSQAAERIADAYPAGQKPTAKEKQQWADEVRKRVVVPSSEANGALPIGWRKILMACAERESAVARRELTIVTGYKRSSRDSYISRLSAKGYLSQSGTGVTITPEGLAALGDYEPLPIGEALRKHWLNKLPMGERAILGVICEAYPDAASKDAISESTGYKRSSRDSYISRLAARELVESDDPGWVKASDKLFD